MLSWTIKLELKQSVIDALNIHRKFLKVCSKQYNKNYKYYRKNNKKYILLEVPSLRIGKKNMVKTSILLW